MATPLLFQEAPYPAGAINLVFGRFNTLAPDPVTVAMQANMPAPTLRMVAVYDNRLTRWRDQRTRCVYEVAQPVRGGTAIAFGVSKRELGGTLLRWEPAAPSGKMSGVPFAPSVQLRRTSDLLWEKAAPIGAGFSALHESARRVQRSRDLLWQLATPLATGASSLMEKAKRLQTTQFDAWQSGQRVGLVRSSGYGRGRALASLSELMLWEQAGRPRHGRELRTLPIAPQVYAPGTVLLFQCPPLAAPWILIFGAKPCYPAVELGAFYILPARFYMTTNTVFAQLLPSLADVPIYAGTTISADVGSYGWTLSATGPASLYDQLKPMPGQPKQIRVTINGLPWIFAIDHPRRTTSFGKDVVQITGRSVTSMLGSQFARDTSRLNTAPATAQQLAALALDNTGVALDWGLEDWLVPAGAWSHTGTPLEAVQAIAAAAGGYVQSARNAATLQVRHPYPLLPGGVLGGPWNWNGAFAPDVTLAPDAIISTSEDLRESPEINAVYVSGATQGVLALVKRAGTAGDLLGSQVTDALITANEAAQQRGLATLGAAGGRIMRRLELPVLTGLNQPGVLSTDQLLGISGAAPWRGRVRAVSVSDSRPALRQNVLVEVA